MSRVVAGLAALALTAGVAPAATLVHAEGVVERVVRGGVDTVAYGFLMAP
jgi:hypothetical protein